MKTFVRAHDVDHGMSLEKAGATAVCFDTEGFHNVWAFWTFINLCIAKVEKIRINTISYSFPSH